MSSKGALESVLVVGGCGFLGHRIVLRLLDLHPKPQVFVLDLQTDRNQVPSVGYYNVDISNRGELLDVVRQIQPQVIIHTASPPPAIKDIDVHLGVNVIGTHNLLECASEVNNIQAFVYTSTASVISDAENDIIDGDESLPLVFLPAQKAVYAHAKALADRLVTTSNRKYGNMLTVSIRPAGLFGENDLTTIKPMIEAARAGSYKFQVGNGQNLFDWTYVENAASAHILAAQALLTPISSSTKSRTQGIDGEAFLITNDEHMPFWEFARAIGAAAGFPTKKKDIKIIPKSVGLFMATVLEWVVWAASFGRRNSTMNRSNIRYSCMTRTFRIEKAKKRLGYRPQVNMQEGIRRSVESFLSVDKKAQ